MKYGRFIERRIKTIKWFRSWVRIPGASLSFFLLSSFFFFFFAFKSVLLVCCRFALRAFRCVCVCAREQIRNPFARKKEGTSTTTTTTRGTSSESRKRFICIGKGWSRTRKKTFCFVFSLFVWSGTLDSGRNSVSVCVCHDNSGTIREEKLFSFFFFLFFFLLWGWLATAGFHSLSDTK